MPTVHYISTPKVTHYHEILTRGEVWGREGGAS